MFKENDILHLLIIEVSMGYFQDGNFTIYPPSTCEWPIQSFESWLDRTKGRGREDLSLCLLIWDISLLSYHQTSGIGSSGSPTLRQDWNYTCSPLGSPMYKWQILGLFGLHSPLSQFLIVNLSIICVSIIYLSTFLPIFYWFCFSGMLS